MSPNITVFGLGAMGFAMAHNLLKAGFNVTGFDVSEAATQRFSAIDGRTASTPSQAVENAEFVLVMVSNADQATTVFLEGGDNAAVNSLPMGATIIVSSTVKVAFYPNFGGRLRNEFDRTDIELLDCPVSGGVTGATNGFLSIFTSGPQSALDEAQPVFDAIGEKIYTIPGGLGAGSKAKMCHQVLPEIDIAVCAEAMALAARAGLNIREVLEKVQQSEGASWIVGDRVKHMVEGEIGPFSVVTNSWKDSSIIMNYAAIIGHPMPLVSTALQVYQAAIHAGWSSNDDSTLWRLYLNNNNSNNNQDKNTIHQQALPNSPIKRNNDFNNQDIVDIFTGVHLAASAEAMRFVQAVGLDTDVMYDIIKGAAGSNRMFIECVPEMKRGAYSLKDVQGSKIVCEKLRDVVAKGNSTGAALPVASAALQTMLRELS